jgi:hypothetical protein
LELRASVRSRTLRIHLTAGAYLSPGAEILTGAHSAAGVHSSAGAFLRRRGGYGAAVNNTAPVAANMILFGFIAKHSFQSTQKLPTPYLSTFKSSNL